MADHDPIRDAAVWAVLEPAVSRCCGCEGVKVLPRILLDDVEIVGVAPTKVRADGSRGWEAKSASAPLVTAFRALPPRRG